MNVLLAKINNGLPMRFRANGFEPLNLTMKHRPPETIQTVPILQNGERPYDLKDAIYFNAVIYPACAHVCHPLPEVAELTINAPKAYFEKNGRRIRIETILVRIPEKQRPADAHPRTFLKRNNI